jgi:hypothetical protein
MNDSQADKDKAWDALLATPESQAFLDKLEQEALAWWKKEEERRRKKKKEN